MVIYLLKIALNSLCLLARVPGLALSTFLHVRSRPNFLTFQSSDVPSLPNIPPFPLSANSLRINTYKCLSKQTTLTSFGIHTYEKGGGEG